jgi:hypothetical protein
MPNYKDFGSRPVCSELRVWKLVLFMVSEWAAGSWLLASGHGMLVVALAFGLCM